MGIGWCLHEPKRCRFPVEGIAFGILQALQVEAERAGNDLGKNRIFPVLIDLAQGEAVSRRCSLDGIQLSAEGSCNEMKARAGVRGLFGSGKESLSTELFYEDSLCIQAPEEIVMLKGLQRSLH